jgi:hypothetical protein
MDYLDNAMTAIRKLGIDIPLQTAPIVKLLEQIEKYDQVKVTAIAATLQQSSTFNAVIREQIDGMKVADRYADVTTQFNSIREDAQEMAVWMSDGKLDFKERMKMNWMRLRRGSIPDRFSDIRDTYLSVAMDASNQLQRETLILDAYCDFRLALKQAEVEGQALLKIATGSLDAAKAELDAAAKQVAAESTDGEGRAQLELKRDEAIRKLQIEDKSYQIVKDIADDLKTSVNTADLVFARLAQTHSVKERVYQRSVTFFATNESVFSGLAASFTAMSGLNEATQTMEAMKDGMNKGLEALAGAGTQALDAGIKAGYGSTLQANSVKMLADAIVNFQETSFTLIGELRQESTRTSNEIDVITEDSKQRFQRLLTKAN